MNFNIDKPHKNSLSIWLIYVAFKFVNIKICLLLFGFKKIK